MRGAGGIAALLALLVTALPTRAQDHSFTLHREIEIRMHCRWPGSCIKGWAPVQVEVRNLSEREQFVRLMAEGIDWNTRNVGRAIELDAHEHLEFELLLPLGGQYQNNYYLNFYSDGESGGGPVLGTRFDTSVRQILYVSETAPAAGEVEAWSSLLSAREVSAGGAPAGTTSVATLGYVGGSIAATPDVDLAHTRFDGLARSWGAYTSLDLVVLDLDAGAPPAAELAPLVAWVRSGGDLLVIGERAEAGALALPELAAWMEPRFRAPHAFGDEYLCGLGRLCIGSEGALVTDYDPWISELLDANGGLTHDPHEWRGTRTAPTIPGLELLPFRTFALVLLVFAFAIGPVNFLFIAKKKKAVLLLVTIPLIAAVTTLLLLGYGVLVQGLDVKTASISVALLDERSHRSSSTEHRQLFAGLAPAEGLAPAPGTFVHAAESGSMNESYEVELGEGVLLGGRFLPSRVPVRQVLSSERAERGRLGVSLAGPRPRVDNNLGVTLDELLVRTPDGACFHLEKRLGPGASAELEPVEAAPTAEGLALDLHRTGLAPAPVEPAGLERALPPGCYLAQLATNPFRDPCGIEENELFGAHVLFGVLPLEEEAWR